MEQDYEQVKKAAERLMGLSDRDLEMPIEENQSECRKCGAGWEGVTIDMVPRRPGMMLLVTATCDNGHEWICFGDRLTDEGRVVDIGPYLGQLGAGRF